MPYSNNSRSDYGNYITNRFLDYNIYHNLRNRSQVQRSGFKGFGFTADASAKAWHGGQVEGKHVIKAHIPYRSFVP